MKHNGTQDDVSGEVQFGDRPRIVRKESLHYRHCSPILGAAAAAVIHALVLGRVGEDEAKSLGGLLPQHVKTVADGNFEGGTWRC